MKIFPYYLISVGTIHLIQVGGGGTFSGPEIFL